MSPEQREREASWPWQTGTLGKQVLTGLLEPKVRCSEAQIWKHTAAPLESGLRAHVQSGDPGCHRVDLQQRRTYWSPSPLPRIKYRTNWTRDPKKAGSVGTTNKPSGFSKFMQSPQLSQEPDLPLSILYRVRNQGTESTRSGPQRQEGRAQSQDMAPGTRTSTV